MIDLVLAGDNAIVVGALAAGLPADQRKKVIVHRRYGGIGAADPFALVVTQLMQIIGLILVGGLLLLWVAVADVARPARASRNARRDPRRSLATNIAA